MKDFNTSSKITLDIYNTKAEITFPNSDLTSDEVVRAFCSLMIAQTFYPASIINSLREIADDLEENFSIDKK